MIDHDRLFKELLTTFFLEFLDLFFPHIATAIDPASIRFLPQEYFADLTAGEDKIIDLLVEAQLTGQGITFLIHIEAQAYDETDFNQRMFFYFARLHQKYRQKIYPIVLFSYDSPQREAPHSYTVELFDQKILEFNFQTIQLNRLNWRDYLNQPNPVAAALMAKMKIAKRDRPRVKVECLRLLATLKLDPARTRLISGFVDTYLRLNAQETQIFQTELARLEPQQQEGIMQIVTSWMEEGIERGIAQGMERGIAQGMERGIAQGREEGMQAGERSLILRQLTRRLGEVPEALRSQIEALSINQLERLGEALLEFATLADLETWLSAN